MEQDMINIQRAWYPQQQDHQPRINTTNLETKSIQTTMETQSVSIQTDPYTCCLDQKTEDITKKAEAFEDTEKSLESNDIIKKTFQEVGSNTEESGSTILNEQLDQTLKLTSERSATLVKLESQLTEYKAKVDALNKMIAEKDSQYQAKVDILNKAIEERDSQYREKMDTLNKAIEEKESHLTQKQNILDELMIQPHVTNTDCTDKLALKSTINSLQKLIHQKEETIMRYQNLLKEDRDEHSRAASRFQDEIKSLHDRILAMQGEIRKTEGPVTVKNVFEKISTCDESTSKMSRNNAAQEEEIARLREKVSTFEAELNISKELSERWHRLAEERLKYMDRMRERYDNNITLLKFN